MAGEWMLKDDWDRIEQFKAENPRLKAEVERLGIELAELREAAEAEVDALRGRAERAEREREVMLKTMVEHDPTYPKAPWVVNKPWGYRLPYRWYLTEAEARAAAYRALGLAAEPVADPVVQGLVAAGGLPAGASDLEGHVCAACGTRATHVGESQAIWCERCGTGRWVSKPKPAGESDPETLDCPQFGAAEGNPPRQDSPRMPQNAPGRVPEG
jgi:DNA-directed RNA polymerase subunit RPC12/RpoP